MNEVLSRSLAPILRDIQTSGALTPNIEDVEWVLDDPNTASAMLRSADGGGTGIYIDVRAPQPERVAAMADQVQEWVIEELWRDSKTNWPPCPNHPNSHPLGASVRDAIAVWACPKDGTPFAPVGSLRAG